MIYKKLKNKLIIYLNIKMVYHNLSDSELQRLKDKHSAILNDISFEIAKREKIKSFQLSLDEELRKLRSTTSLKNKNIVSNSNNSSKSNSSKGSKNKAILKKKSSNDKEWTISEMKQFLKNKNINFKQSMKKVEFITLIKSKNLVREMNIFTDK